ncbi:MAG: DUF3153 domain-containing protein [Synechococcales cyanobacterium M58_A2018_015]|nr:DUF3153 domain-containing protein [Synechococcales cyanobacterium M58_A2018_015]
MNRITSDESMMKQRRRYPRELLYPYPSSRPKPTAPSGLLGLRWTVRLLVKLRLLWIILIAFLFLSGCVRCDVGITMADANHGEFVQQIHLSEQITGINRSLATTWLTRLEQQVQSLGGRTRHLSEEEWQMTVPFYNARDLETKFNQLLHFSSAVNHSSVPTSQLQIRTQNFVFWQRHHLSYDLDLRSLGVLPRAGNRSTLLPPASLRDWLELEFRLNTPWGARADFPGSLAAQSQGKQLIWQLQPGEVNHLEALFWVPSPLGIGAGVIVVLVGLGMATKAWMSHFPPEEMRSSLGD